MSGSWSFFVLDAHGEVVSEESADSVRSTASVGKIFLLCEVAERTSDGRLDPTVPIRRDPAVRVADSGLWQHLEQDSLALADACVLIGAVSDNWATNVVLDRVGLAAVEVRATALGCRASGLRDRVRDARSAMDPPTLSEGSARELAEVARRIHQAAAGVPQQGISVEAARLVEGWLLTGVDLSMVAAPLGLDPLAHAHGAVRLWSKTGTDAGVRADMGVIWSASGAVAYAAIANWDPREDRVVEAMQHMHELGAGIAARVR